MRITVIGSGYVGLVTGTCLSEVGNKIVCLDLDASKIENLKKGIVPIYEPDLEEMIQKNVDAGRLAFTTSVEDAIRFGDVIFIAVGTPPGEDGSADLHYVLGAAESIAKHMDAYKVIVNKSTVPVGTADMVSETISNVLQKRSVSFSFDVVSNPEFLREGSAIRDFMYPDRIVIGVSTQCARDIMTELYSVFQFKKERILLMDVFSAELTKYAANAMLAPRISFMNELARLSERLGADIGLVRKGIGSDPRIGYDFLYPGCGYGGSCFPKDVSALIQIGKANGIDMTVIQSVETANERQKEWFSQKILDHYDELEGKTFALWGLSFKPETDDLREAPSETIITQLLKKGAKIQAYDPVAMQEAKKKYQNQEGLTFAISALEALDGCDGLVIVTEWKEFRSPDWADMKTRMKQPIIFDGRNIYQSDVPRKEGFTYFSIGRR